MSLPAHPNSPRLAPKPRRPTRRPHSNDLFGLERVSPGTTREVVVYVPKQHDGITAACVYVNQDGLLWRAPATFDNLIESGELPVIVSVFISPGVVKPEDGGNQQDVFNRSQEYDGLGDQRVFSAIGSYVALRGGFAWSTLIRKTEPKPIRVFLEDGSNDLNNYAGDWWIANLAMERDLQFSGYEVKSAFGDGAHDPLAEQRYFRTR